MFVVPALLAAANGADAATISWGAVFPITGPADISNAGAPVQAVNASNAAENPAPVNGVTFTNGAPFGSVGAGTFWTSVNGSFGDAGLDAIADSHSWQGGNPGLATLSLSGLSIGQSYQLQLIGVMDGRGCCATRTYDVDDGDGAYTTGVTLQRGLGQSVIGTFVADADGQTVLIRSAGDLAGNNDPGLSAYALRAVPEPSSMALLFTATVGLFLVARRR